MTAGALVGRAARGMVAVSAVGLVVALVLGLVPRWPCALAEHFRVQYLIAGVILTVAAAGIRVRGYFDVAAIATLVHALWVVPDLVRSREPVPSGGVHVRVLLLNVHRESSGFDQVRALIADVDPDIIGLVEVDDRWLRGVASAVAGYHGRLEHPTNDNFGIALYARAPMAGGIEDHLQPTAIAHVDVGAGRSIDVVLVHPFPPVTAETTASQHAELAELAVRVRELAGPTIVMGDFNTTPWSREFRAFAEETGLCDSRAGWGLQASWPAWLAVMRIPIDHLFATCSVGITGRRIERDVGSDHLPVVVDLVVP